MANEDIKIRIASEYDDRGAKQAKKDEEELQKGKDKTGSPGSRSGRPNEMTARHRAEMQSIYKEELGLIELRAKGKKKEADEVERQIFTRKRAVELERQYGFERKKAVEYAEREAAGHKAGGGHGGMAGMARMIGEPLDMITGQQGWVMRTQQAMNIRHLLSGMGLSRAAMAGVGAAAAAVGAGLYIGHEYIAAKDEQRAMRDRLREEAGADSRRLARTRNYGSAEEAFGQYLDWKDKAAALRDHRATLMDAAHSGVMGRFAKFVGSKYYEEGWGWWKPQSAKDLEENKAQTEQADRMTEKNKAAAAKWFARTGRRSIDASELRSHGLSSEAEKIDIDLAVEAEKQRLKKANASAADIQRGMAAKRKELEEGGYARFLKEGGESALRVQELMNQGKISEAQAVETAVVWWDKYNDVLGKVGPKHADVAKRAADAAAYAHEEGGFARFSKEGGMDAIHAQELMNQGKVKEARILQDNVAWWAKYNEVLAQVGPKHAEVAKEAADADVFARQRERAGSFQGAITARAGVAETTRVATLAAHAMGRDVKESVDKFHDSSVSAWRQSSEENWRRKFPSSWKDRVKGAN